MSRLAIVIPSVGSVEALENTLLAVLENRPPRSEVLVVHAHPYNDPYQLQGEVRLIKAPLHAGFVACANLGLRETTADIVHLLAAGCQVREGWCDGAMKHFADPRVAVVAPMLVDQGEATHTVAAGLCYGIGGVRRETTRFVADVLDAGLSPILAASLYAVFYNRVTLSTVGYLSDEVGADLADIDLGLLLQHAGFKSLVDPRLQVRAPNRPLESVSAFRRALRNERLFWRNLPFAGGWKSLVAHPLAVLADMTRHLPSLPASLMGRMVGAVMIGTARRHHQRLKDLCNTAPVLAGPANARQVRIDRPHDGKNGRSEGKAARVG